MIKRLLLPACLVLILCILVIGLTFSSQVIAHDSPEDYVSIVYIHGIGCQHCARTDPTVLIDLPAEYPGLIIIGYEIYKMEQNAPLLDKYHSVYAAGYEIPVLIFNRERNFSTDVKVLKNIRPSLDEVNHNPVPLIDGSSIDFQELDLLTLPGYPEIWHKNKIAFKTGPVGDNELLKNLIIDDDLSGVLKGKDYTPIEPVVVEISGKDIEFDNAILVGDWIFQWNGDRMGINPTQEGEYTPKTEPAAPVKYHVTMAKIISLALVDAINPCAFAVLLLLLTAILAYNPGNKRSVLLAGLMFIAAVFAMYFSYGLIFIKFFQLIQTLNVVKIWLFRTLAVAAIIFGILNIRDFLKYRPGGPGTEMPLMLRPRMQAMIAKVTSPKGAFVAGILVTLFLLPCTIGPYVIAAGILSVFDMLANIPVLIVYNLIFILPMMAIVGIVYLGLSGVKDIEQWKNRHITRLHLAAGILMLFVGVALLMGWV
jgi:hypothetical protein